MEQAKEGGPSLISGGFTHKLEPYYSFLFLVIMKKFGKVSSAQRRFNMECGDPQGTLNILSAIDINRSLINFSNWALFNCFGCFREWEEVCMLSKVPSFIL